MMHYIGGCGEMDNIVLRSATSPSCKMRCGDGLQLVDVRRWTTLYYNLQPFCKMRCGKTDYIIYTMYENYFEHVPKHIDLHFIHNGGKSLDRVLNQVLTILMCTKSGYKFFAYGPVYWVLCLKPSRNLVYCVSVLKQY
jgi:endogenous inhibitor of DNA gyrase (YacG/DUF329 family)